MAFKKMDLSKINDLAEELQSGYPSIVDGIGRLYLKSGEIANLRFMHANNLAIPVLYHTVWSVGSNGRSSANKYLCEKMFSDDSLASCKACMDNEGGHNDVKAVRPAKLYFVYNYDRVGKVYNKNGISTQTDTLYALFVDNKDLINELQQIEIENGPLNEYDISIQTVKTGPKSYEVKHNARPKLKMEHGENGAIQVIDKEDFDYTRLDPSVVEKLSKFPFEPDFKFNAALREHAEMVDEFANLMIEASGILDMGVYKTPKVRMPQQPMYPPAPSQAYPQQGYYPQQVPMYPAPHQNHQYYPMYPPNPYVNPQHPGQNAYAPPNYNQASPQHYNQAMPPVVPQTSFQSNEYAAPPGVKPNPNYSQQPESFPSEPFQDNDPWLSN